MELDRTPHRRPGGMSRRIWRNSFGLSWVVAEVKDQWRTKIREATGLSAKWLSKQGVYVCVRVCDFFL